MTFGHIMGYRCLSSFGGLGYKLFFIIVNGKLNNRVRLKDLSLKEKRIKYKSDEIKG